MLRRRLFICLITLVITLWCTGATGLLLMRDSVARFESEFQQDIKTIDAAITLRTLTVTLNCRYLTTLASGEKQPPPDRTLYNEIKEQIRQKQAVIHSRKNRDNRWVDAVTRMDEAIITFLDGYEQFFAPRTVESNQSQMIHQLIASNTQQLTEVTNTMLAISEGWLHADVQRLDEDEKQNSTIIVFFILIGTILAVFIHRELSKLLIEPLTSLCRSIKEIQKGNFEMPLPVPGKKNELTDCVVAFNEMTVELQKRSSQNDENLKRINIVNQAILEAIPSPVFVLGDDGRIIQMNPAAETLTENLGTMGRLPMKIQRVLDDCLASRSHHLPQDPKDALLFRINEEEQYFLPRIFHFESGDDSLSGWAVLLHNVSRIRWLDDMKTSLIATVSHEIKTPLTGIRMALLLMLEERAGQLDNMQRTLLTSANEDCERLLVTVNGLLDLAVAESGAIHLNRVPIDLKVIVEKSVARLIEEASAKSLVMRVEANESRFPKVLADPERIEAVLNNLISNAINHSPDGGEIVLVISKPDAEHIRSSVIDHGPGVPEDSQPRIFERFYRAPGQDSEGLGLGLFISRDIMIAHEGRIGLLDRTDSFTEFFIDVPIA